MTEQMAAKLLRQMEEIRSELYAVVNDNPQRLLAKETYELSTRLDGLIVKHMRYQARQKSRASTPGS